MRVAGNEVFRHQTLVKTFTCCHSCHSRQWSKGFLEFLEFRDFRIQGLH